VPIYSDIGMCQGLRHELGAFGWLVNPWGLQHRHPLRRKGAPLRQFANDARPTRSTRKGCQGLLRQRPEWADEAEAFEDLVVLVSGSRAPVRMEAGVPPCVSEVAQDLGGDRGARSSCAKPSCDVLLRPEEVHGASGEDDVVPPTRGWYETVEEQVRTVDSPFFDLHEVGLATIGARRLHSTVDGERAENAESVPSTIGVPPTA
jgi:hypothetical protein